MTNFAKTERATTAAQIKWEQDYQRFLIEYLRTHEEFDGSAVAKWMRKQGIGEPMHHNMWGAQISYYAGAGWIEAIGRTIPTGAAHVAQVRVWRSKLYQPRKAKRAKKTSLLAATYELAGK